MKHLIILFSLLVCTASLMGQSQPFQDIPNKMRTGDQTTGRGLVPLYCGIPDWSPTNIKQAWAVLDTCETPPAVRVWADGAWQIISGGGIDSTLASNGLTLSGDTVQLGGTLTKNTEVDTDGKTLRFRDAGGYPDFFMNNNYGLISSDINTYLDVGSTAGRVRIVGASNAEVTSAGNALVSATDTVVVTGQRIRLNGADTRVQQVPKDNALNRLVALDSLTGRLYYVDKSSISGGGGGTVTGTGTTGTIPVWSSSTALGDSPLTVASGNVSVTGTGAFRLGNWTTAGRPGTPTSGMKGYNTTLGYSETYGASAWLQSAFPAGTTSHTLRYDGTSWVSNSFLFNNGSAVSIGSTTIDVDAANGRFYVQNTGGLARQYIVGSSTARLGVWGKTSGAVFSLNTGGTTSPAVSYYIGNQTISTTDLMTFGRRAGNFGDPTDGDLMRLDGVNRRVMFGFLAATSLPLANMHVNSNTSDNNTLYLDNIFVGPPAISLAPGLTFRGRPQSGDDPLPYARILGAVENTGNASTYDGQIQLQTALNGTLGTNVTILSSGNVGIGTATPARSLDAGEVRIRDLTTDTPTRIVGADADGDLGAITIGSGLDLTAGTLSATATGTTNLSLSGSAPITLNSSTGTDVHFRGGNNILLSRSGDTMTIAHLPRQFTMTVTDGSTFFGTTFERPDNDTPGTATSGTTGTFTASGSTVDYVGTTSMNVWVNGSISFSIADDVDVYISMFKEGVEIDATSTRITCVAGNYYTVTLPRASATASTNDTFDLRIKTATGNSTTTMHRYGFTLETIF
jgi:hypothetical protein